jgi:hypothetical protein
MVFWAVGSARSRWTHWERTAKAEPMQASKHNTINPRMVMIHRTEWKRGVAPLCAQTAGKLPGFFCLLWETGSALAKRHYNTTDEHRNQDEPGELAGPTL